MPNHHRSKFVSYGTATLAVAVAWVVRLVLASSLGHRQPFGLFVMAVTVVAWREGPGPALLAIVLGGVGGSILLIQSGIGPTSPDSVFAVSVVLYALVCLVFVAFSAANRRALQKLRAEVAERHRAELDRESLREQRGRLEAAVEDRTATIDLLLQQVPVGIVLIDAAMKCALVNPYAASLVGLSPAAVEGRSFEGVYRGRFTDGSVDLIMGRVHTVMETGAADRVEALPLTERDAPGRALFIDLSARRYDRADGTRLGVLLTLTDVSVQRLRESALKESDERFRSLVESDMIGIGFWDDDGRITDANDALRSMLGYPGAAFTEGRVRWAAITPDAYASLDAEAFRQAKLQGSCRPFEKELIRSDGSRVPVIFGAATFRGVGDRGPFFALDISERKRLERELNGRVRELAESHRRKDEFLALMSHELRNPLAPIHTAIYVLRKGEDDPEAREKVLGILDRQVGRLTHLVNDLLDLSRINGGRVSLKRSTVDLEQIAGRAVEATRPAFEEHRHEFLVMPARARLRVDGDPMRLEQVLVNLLNNAAKYTDPGGRIALRFAREGGEAVVRVIDSGIGIEPSLLGKIFDPFYQAERRVNRSEGGLGLGLSISRSLAELHGGTVVGLSRGPGQGSTFELRLPALAAEGSDELTPSSRTPAVAPGVPPRRRVLVVDDNEAAADSLGHMLTRLYKQDVRIAYDGPTAIEAAGLFRPDVVLLDIGMPVMDGLEVARRLKGLAEHKETVLVAVTGWGQDDDRRKSMEAGFDLHLVKPVEPEVFRALLDNLPTGGVVS